MPISLLTSLSCEIYSDVRKHPLNSKPIPQIDPTNYLALFRRCCSIKIRYQTFSVVMGERNPFFPVSAPGLQCKMKGQFKKKCLIFIFTENVRLQSTSMIQMAYLKRSFQVLGTLLFCRVFSFPSSLLISGSF